MIQVLCLWNPDHLSGQGSLTSAIAPAVTGLWSDTTTNYSLFALPGLTDYSWNVVTFNGRRWLRTNKTTATTNRAFITVAASVISYSGIKTKYPNAKRVYQTIRIYVPSCKGGALLLCDSTGAGYYGVTANNEYFVEVVTNLENNTRTIYVNGVVTANTFPTGSYVGVGDFNGTMFNAAGQGHYITDYVFAISEDVSPPTRLGKISVKTLKGVSTSGSDQFTAVGSGSSIGGILTNGRDATPPNAVTVYVNSDSNGGKLNLNWAPVANGDTVIGAMFRGSAIKLPSADAEAYMSINGLEKVIATSNTNAASPLPAITPLTIPNPGTGWSEERLSLLTIQLYSKRP